MADVFISHSSKDKVIADHICAELEKKGIKCWIAPRDIKPGEEWARAINTAITSSSAFIVIYSGNSAQSTQVPKEIGLAGAKNSYIIPYKIDDTKLTDEFEYYLLGSHWVIADIEKKDFKIEELYNVILSAKAKKIAASANIEEEGGKTVNNFNVTEIKDSNVTYTTTETKGKIAIIISAAAALVVVICTIIIVSVFSSQPQVGSNDSPTTTISQESDPLKTTTAAPKTTTSLKTTAAPQTTADKSKPLNTELCFNFIENDHINRYDVSLFINDQYSGIIEHGKTTFLTLPYSEGTYTITVIEVGDEDNYDSKTVKLTATEGYGYTFDIKAGWTGVHIKGGEKVRF